MAKTKHSKRKNPNGYGSFDLSWSGFNHALTTLEKGAEKFYGKLYSEFKKTIPTPWAKKMGQLSYKDIMKLAAKKHNMITKEVRYYADGIVKTLNGADILPNKNRLVKEAKQSLKSFLAKVQKSNVAHQAKSLAAMNGSKILSLLNFPSKKEVSRLNARLGQLEKRLKGLGAHSPRRRA